MTFESKRAAEIFSAVFFGFQFTNSPEPQITQKVGSPSLPFGELFFRAWGSYSIRL